MPFTRSFENYKPPKRFDGLPYTQALIRESAAQTSGYATIETKTLSPVDADPTNPAARNFTTALATLAAGWYIIEWKDASGAVFDSDPVYSPTAGTALTTLADVKAFLQITTTVQDAPITALISPASKAIMKWCEREFAPANTVTTRTFVARRANAELLVDVNPYDLQSVSAVSIDSDQTNPYVLSTDEWRLRPKPALDGVYQFVRLFPFGTSTGRVLWRNREVNVTGTWGFPAVPPDVAQAAILTIAIWRRQDVGAFGPSLLVDDQQSATAPIFPAAPGQIPPGVRKLLMPWKRMGV